MNTKTRTEWEAEFAAPAAASGFLSAAAEWLGLRKLVIDVVLIFQYIMQQLYTDTKNYVDTKDPGTIYWYPGMVKAFQYGDSLTLNEGRPEYATIDTAKQIVSQCSVREMADGSLQIKVAKTDAGSLVPLTNTELNALKDYIKARRSPGVAISVISRNADVVKTTITLKYDPLYNQADVDAAVEAARLSFRNNFRFDAVFYKAQLFEDIMAVPGVVSLLLQIDMTLSDGTTVTNLTEFTEMPAGYFNYDGTSTYVSTPA